MTRSRDEILLDAEEHLVRVLRYAEQDLDDQLVIDAICMRLSAGVEVLATLDPQVRTILFGSRVWAAMWGMRNRIAHGYLLVDPTIVRRTVETDIPAILRIIRGARS